MESKIKNISDYKLSCSNSETLDLNNIHYSINDLKRIVECSGVSLKCIIRTQILTIEFCKDYILNKEYHILDSDSNIDINYILTYQKHIKKNELIEKDK